MSLYQNNCTELTQIFLNDPAFWVLGPSAINSLEVFCSQTKPWAASPKGNGNLRKYHVVFRMRKYLFVFSVHEAWQVYITHRHSKPFLPGWKILP